MLELGLDQAFDTAITLIEWPDRLGRLVPKGALRLALAAKGEGRAAQIWLGQRADLLPALRAGWAPDV